MMLRTGLALAAGVAILLCGPWVQAAEQQGEVHISINGQEVQPGAGGVTVQAEARRGPAEGRAWLGVELGREEAGGAAVAEVMPDGPAAVAGIKAGDVITAVDGKDVGSPMALVERVGEHQPGDRAVLAVKREGRKLDVAVILGRSPGEPAARRPEARPEGEQGRRFWVRPGEQPPAARRPEARPEGEPPRARGQVGLGITAAPMPPEMKDMAGTDKGVLINSIADGSPAAKAGLVAGDVIISIDGKATVNPGQVVDIMHQHKAGDQVKVAYFRMGKRQEAVVTLSDVAAPSPRTARGYGTGPMPGGQGGVEGMDDLLKQMPEIQGFIEKMMPNIEEWAKEYGKNLPPGANPFQPGAPVPGGEMPQARPGYDMGKDMGRLMERLDRIEKRLNEIEKRMNQSEKR
jgi:membrane-associated protease RseP (regulator of RpoE activity)